MRTLLEDLLTHDRIPAGFKADLRSAVFVRANNVMEYMLVNGRNFLDVVDSFPTVTPPFAVMWIEYAYQNPGNSLSVRSGFLVRRYDLTADGKSEKHLRSRYRDTQARWAVEAMLYFHAAGMDDIEMRDNGGPLYGFMMAIDEDGTISTLDGVPQIHAANADENAPIDDTLLASNRELFSVVLMTLALMHCKNVTLEEIDPTLRADGSRRRRNRHEQPAVKYRIIKIRPMTHRAGGGDWEGGGAPSMHIRRGHFKDYRYGTGLFGKFNGLYWWESAVVGKEQTTRVEKTYEVEPPE